MKIDDIKVNIKRFFSNPNTLTFFFVLILIGIVYGVYSNAVSKSVSPESVSYANTNIASQTEITADMINSIEISGNFVSKAGANLLKNRPSVLNHRVKEDYNILKGSFFYKDAIETEANTKRKTDTADIPDNYAVYTMKTDFHSTYGCSIMPGDYIDLYVKAKNPSNNQIIFNIFISSIKIHKIINSNYEDVFKTLEDETCNPAFVEFVIPIEQYELLKRAEMMPNLGFKLIMVPRNASYSQKPNPTKIESEFIKNLIEEQSVIE